MPELPEVEVVRLGLAAGVINRLVGDVDVLHARAVRRQVGGASDFVARLRGRQFLAACRRGKYLWLPLDSGEALLAHLGMSGQLRVVPPNTPTETHLRVRFTLDGDRDLRFVDQRTFGGLAVVDMDSDVPLPVAHIARDPLDPLFDAGQFITAVLRRRTGVKRALLDQTLVSGVGNIYADEALWRSRLHYARATDTLRRADVARLLDQICAVLRDALAAGGTTFDGLYVDVAGDAGMFERELAVYGRGGEPCARCGTPIRREPFMNRSSYFCPRCQRQPRNPHW